MGLRGVRRRLGYLVGHRAILRLYGKQAELHVRVPDGWKINVSASGRSVTPRQFHVGYPDAGNDG